MGFDPNAISLVLVIVDTQTGCQGRRQKQNTDFSKMSELGITLRPLPKKENKNIREGGQHFSNYSDIQIIQRCLV